MSAESCRGLVHGAGMARAWLGRGWGVASAYGILGVSLSCPGMGNSRLPSHFPALWQQHHSLYPMAPKSLQAHWRQPCSQGPAAKPAANENNRTDLTKGAI